ncbi:MAG: hypothetical protein JSV13_01850 [Nitrospiraceae bacterium]|jgi:hypothetical protein|nr:MAG: hypothetical protein JSV13_01850 [Nitrospiraceae bacterium]
MGIVKLWLKHGPGSPGSIAKSLSEDYVKWRNIYPSASHEELLGHTLKNRLLTEKMFRFEPLTEKEQERLIKRFNGSLKELIVFIVQRENPSAAKQRSSMMEVINEVMENYPDSNSSS